MRILSRSCLGPAPHAQRAPHELDRERICITLSHTEPVLPDAPAAPVTDRPLDAPQLVEPGSRLLTALLELVLFVVTLGVGWLVWSVLEWRHARTPAKRLRHQQVVLVRGGAPAGFGRMCSRQLGGGAVTFLLGLSTCGIGWLFAAWLVFSPSRQALWDRIAGTTVAGAR